MGWFEDLRNTVSRATSQGTSGLKRLAGQALKTMDAPFVRPMIGFKPELGGAILSAVLPEENPVKKLADVGLYLTSGPLMMTAGLAGSTPQTDDQYGNWRNLGYKSREDMISRVEKQKAFETSLASRPPNTYIADDYGPPRPVMYSNGTVLVGDYRIDRFKPTVAEAETAAPQPQRNAVAPASRRPLEESHAPVSRPVPASPVPQSQEQIRKAVETEMLAKAANQERTAELMRSMIELGVTGGMTGDNMREWVSKNPVLAQNLIKDRLGRKERLAEEFAGFADYAQ